MTATLARLVLAAAKRRNRPDLRDGLWRASCWAETVVEPGVPRSRAEAAFVRLAEIVEGDVLAELAVIAEEDRARNARRPATAGSWGSRPGRGGW